MWDVFISHAWEDKDDVARPLANELLKASLRVWYDEFTLKLGDSLSRTINHGLAESTYGVVILSPSFFNKKWPQRELEGLTTREMNSRTTILPVWHKVTQKEVEHFSPPLADKVSVSTDKGLEVVVQEILRVVQGEPVASAMAAVEATVSESPIVKQPQVQPSLAPYAQEVRRQLKECAQRYESIRRDMPSGSARTLELSRIVEQARGLAEKAGYSSIEISELFTDDSEGDRIVSLALIQAMPNVDFFEVVVTAISESRSAFEQYHALYAIKNMLPILQEEQNQKLVRTLRDQRRGGPGSYIVPGSDRWVVSESILRAIQD